MEKNVEWNHSSEIRLVLFDEIVYSEMLPICHILEPKYKKVAIYVGNFHLSLIFSTQKL